MFPSCKRALVIAVVAAAMGGCSFRIVIPPPPPSEWPTSPRHGSPEARCTRSLFPPAIDTGAALLLGGVAVAERTAQSWETPVIFAVATIPVIAGAVYGYVVTAECRRYQRLYDAP